MCHIWYTTKARNEYKKIKCSINASKVPVHPKFKWRQIVWERKNCRGQIIPHIACVRKEARNIPANARVASFVDQDAVKVLIMMKICISQVGCWMFGFLRWIWCLQCSNSHLEIKLLFLYLSNLFFGQFLHFH